MIDNLNYSQNEVISQSKQEFCIIICTVPDNVCAQDIAHLLLTSNLAACVTLLPGATSIYTWQGMIKQQLEVQLFIKSKLSLSQAVFSQIKTRHSYQTPELLVVPITEGDSDYLSWLNESLTLNKRIL